MFAYYILLLSDLVAGGVLVYFSSLERDVPDMGEIGVRCDVSDKSTLSLLALRLHSSNNTTA